MVTSSSMVTVFWVIFPRIRQKLSHKTSTCNFLKFVVATQTFQKIAKYLIKLSKQSTVKQKFPILNLILQSDHNLIWAHV
jgi:hypothetical protein